MTTPPRPDRDPLAELMSRAVDDLEPRHALDDIRARTAGTTRESTMRARPWTYLLAGAAAMAAIVGGVAVAGLVGDDRPPIASPSSSPVPSSVPAPVPSPTLQETSRPAPTTRAVPVYYLVDTERAGTRLVREFRHGDPQDPLASAVELLQAPALDPDYRTGWPEGSLGAVTFTGSGRDGLFEVTLADASLRERPAGMGEEEAQAAVEQVIWTLQGVEQVRAPVQFRLGDNPVDQVLGVPTSEPLAQGEPLGVLNHLNITTPEQGAEVADTMLLSGVANTFEADVAWEIRRDGDVVRKGFAWAGWQEPRLYPFEKEIDLSGLPAGEYTIWATTYDPSTTEGSGAMTDSKEFTIR